MTTNTNTDRGMALAQRLAAQIIAGEVDEFDRAAMATDDGLQIDGCVAWLTERETVLVWMGNDDDYDMQRLAEVAVTR